MGIDLSAICELTFALTYETTEDLQPSVAQPDVGQKTDSGRIEPYRPDRDILTGERA